LGGLGVWGLVVGGWGGGLGPTPPTPQPPIPNPQSPIKINFPIIVKICKILFKNNF